MLAVRPDTEKWKSSVNRSEVEEAMRANLGSVARILAIVAPMATLAQAKQQNKIPPPSTLPRMVRWTDPTGSAFTVNVPSGWRIAGDTHRNSPIDARNYVAAESPDGKRRVWIDAPDILPRQEPIPPTTAWVGMKAKSCEPGRAAGHREIQERIATCPGIHGGEAVPRGADAIRL
jgi:hypothetical protein